MAVGGFVHYFLAQLLTYDTPATISQWGMKDDELLNYLSPESLTEQRWHLRHCASADYIGKAR